MNHIKDIFPTFSEAEISAALNICNGNVEKAVDSLLDVDSKTCCIETTRLNTYPTSEKKFPTSYVHLIHNN